MEFFGPPLALIMLRLMSFITTEETSSSEDIESDFSLFRSCNIQACILFLILLTIFEYGNFIPYFVPLYIIKCFLLETFALPPTAKMERRLLEHLPQALVWKSYTKEFANNKYNTKGECAIFQL